MKKRIQSDNAPAAIGPYSQAIKVDNFLFCSGQVPLNPESMKVEAQDVVGQTEQVLKNIKAVLTAADTGVDEIVKTTIFLASMDDFKAVNEVYEGFFKEHNVEIPPARSTVEVSKLPLGVLVEIETIAVSK